MTKRAPRIEIRPEIWPALQVEAISRGMSPKEMVNTLILEAMSPKSREFIHEPMSTMSPCTHEPMSPAPRAPPVLRDLAGEKVEDMVSTTTPKPELTNEARHALAYILEELEAGREPTSREAADKVGLTPTGLGMQLSKHGIKTHNTHRGKASVKIYTKPMKARIKEILGKN